MQNRVVRKSNKSSRATILLVLLVVVVIVAATVIRSLSLSEKRDELAITEVQLEQQLEEANNKADELAEREKYMKTTKYIEDEAKNKLGLVNKDEILIKPKDRDY